MKEIDFLFAGKTDEEIKNSQAEQNAWDAKYKSLESDEVEFQGTDVLINGTFVGSLPKNLTCSVADMSEKINTLADDFFGGGNCE